MEETTNREKAQVPAPAFKNIELTKGVMPTDFEDVTRFAALVHASGLAPKGFDTAQKCAIGILTNMEMGRPIITGLQDLAIINGKCGIYGGATIAMILASGEMEEGYPIEKETGTPYEDDWTFTYTVKRKRRPEATGKWTWKDSKRAGFDEVDKHLPWARFPQRMMQWKARAWVNQDQFGDILRGMKTVEELHDYVDMDVQSNGTFQRPPPPLKIKGEKPKGEVVYEIHGKDTVDQTKLAEFDQLLNSYIGNEFSEAAEDENFPEQVITDFIQLCADTYKSTPDQIKVEAVADFDNFWSNLKPRIVKALKSEETPPPIGPFQENPPPSDEYLNGIMKQKGQDEPQKRIPTPSEIVRKQAEAVKDWVSIKTPETLKAWVNLPANLVDIPTWPKPQQLKLQSKWLRFGLKSEDFPILIPPGEKPPLDVGADFEKPDWKEARQNGLPDHAIMCPYYGKERSREECDEGCPSQDGKKCQYYVEKWGKEAP